jgi:hypothetical protein
VIGRVVGEHIEDEPLLDRLRTTVWFWPSAGRLGVSLQLHHRVPLVVAGEDHPLRRGVRAPATYSFRLWTEYVEEYRRLIEAAGVDGRTLDRALWEWSSEQGTA